MASQTRGLGLGTCRCRSSCRCYRLWMQSGKDCTRLSDAVMVLTPHSDICALNSSPLPSPHRIAVYGYESDSERLFLVSSFSLTFIDGIATRCRPCACIYSAHVSPRLFNNDPLRSHDLIVCGMYVEYLHVNGVDERTKHRTCAYTAKRQSDPSGSVTHPLLTHRSSHAVAPVQRLHPARCRLQRFRLRHLSLVNRHISSSLSSRI